jgi:chaperonin cofactor prefoldin
MATDLAARRERLALAKELQHLQQSLAKGRLEVKTLEAQLKENRTKAEEAR